MLRYLVPGSLNVDQLVLVCCGVLPTGNFCQLVLDEALLLLKQLELLLQTLDRHCVFLLLGGNLLQQSLICTSSQNWPSTHPLALLVATTCSRCKHI